MHPQDQSLRRETENAAKVNGKRVKGFRLYFINGPRIIHLISWHQIREHHDSAADFSLLKDAGLIPEDMVRLCVIVLLF